MAKIKVAVIGAGMMGKNHLKTYKSLPNVELVGVYDIFPEAAQKAAETFGVKVFSRKLPKRLTPSVSSPLPSPMRTSANSF